MPRDTKATLVLECLKLDDTAFTMRQVLRPLRFFPASYGWDALASCEAVVRVILQSRARDSQPCGTEYWRSRSLRAYAELRTYLGHPPTVTEMRSFLSPHPLSAVALKRIWGTSALRKLRRAAGPPYPAHGLYGTHANRR